MTPAFLFINKTIYERYERRSSLPDHASDACTLGISQTGQELHLNNTPRYLPSPSINY